MTRPRPSRRARWTIGLSLVTIFAAVTFGAVMVALAQVTANLPDSDGYRDPDWADATARATILDVDLYNLDDVKQSQHFDRLDGANGYAVVDITFLNGGLAVEQTPVSVAAMGWPDDQALPEVGDVVEIEYNSYDPEDGPEIAGTAAGNRGSGIDPVVASTPVAGSEPSSGVTAPVRWTIAISGLLTLLTLIGTVVWARRAAPAERPDAPDGWGRPGWQPSGWQPSGWQPSGTGPHPQAFQQPGWPPQTQQYPSPQPYQPQHYPQPQPYQPEHYPQPQPPTRDPQNPAGPPPPVEPPPGGLTPPG